MTFEIIVVLVILGTALILFVSELIRMDVVSLMVLSTLALLGLVSPEQALSGFSNPAVVTVWAMFILSEGLSRAGIANLLATNVLRIAGHDEFRLVGVVMLIAGVLSGFMNNIGVAALMLPVVIDVARRTNVPASRLLMPLAYGSLLGGLTTLVGTPPNLLASQVLFDAGLQPFRLFDFTPIGGAILLLGTLFVAKLGRHLLPSTTLRDTESERSEILSHQYGLRERMFNLRLPREGIGEGRALSDLGLTTSAGLVVFALQRDGGSQLLPNPRSAVREGDVLLVQGSMDRFDALRKWRDLSIETEAPALTLVLSELLQVRELTVADTSSLLGRPPNQTEFREKFGANLLAVRRGDEVRHLRLGDLQINEGDHLLVQCDAERIDRLDEAKTEFSAVEPISARDKTDIYALEDHIFAIHVPQDSEVAGMTLTETRLAEAFDFRLLAIARQGKFKTMPAGAEVVEGGDLLVVQGSTDDVDVLRRLQYLEVMHDITPNMGLFESDHLRMIEVTLDPHSSHFGHKVSQLSLRELYQLELAAIWRNGRPYRSELADMELRNGDALLLIGPREQCAALKDNPDFIVLTPVSFEKTDARKAPVAGSIMLVVVLMVLLGLLPIAIAAVLGATAMVLSRCLSMEEAYRAIDWRSIFLIAGMLPLGIAMEETGAAEYIAVNVMEVLGGHGPWVVIAGLYAITAFATMIIPTAALIVLMGPIVLSASAAMGTTPQTAMMAVAIAASASFTSPISHPANVLVMGPGGYRFVDYLKLGVPLTIVVFLIAALTLPWLWPLN